MAAAPAGLPPWQTVYGWFRQWKTRDVTERILDELRKQIHLAEDRDAEPSAGVIDTQSVKGADTVGIALLAAHCWSWADVLLPCL